MKVYLASPFFNENEISIVDKAEKILRDKGLDVWSPREHEVRDHETGTRKWSEDTFLNDKDNIDTADLMVMLYHGGYSDTGTAWECGYAFAKKVPCIVVHVSSNSNLMVHEGCYSNLNGLDELEKYDFAELPRKNYEGAMF